MTSAWDQIDEVRRQIVEAMPSMLGSEDATLRAQFIAQIEHIADQAAEDEEPGSPWLGLALFARACAALLSDQPYDKAALLPEDRARLDAWARGDMSYGEGVTLEDAIASWRAIPLDDDGRALALLELLNLCANAVVQISRSGDQHAAEMTATTLESLREDLDLWQANEAAALIGAFQALLRNNPDLLAEYRGRLGPEVSVALAHVEQLIVADDDELELVARDARIADVRSAAIRDVDAVLRGGNQADRDGLVEELQRLSDESATGEEAGSPWLSLATFLRACVAVIRGEQYDPTGLPVEDLTHLSSWAGLTGASAIAGELPPAVVDAVASGDPRALEESLAALSEAERALALDILRRKTAERIAEMDPEQQHSIAMHMRSQQIAAIAAETLGFADEALRDGDENSQHAMAAQMDAAAEHYATGEEPGSPYADLAAFMRGMAAVLRGEPAPEVPAEYAERLERLKTKD